MRSIDDVIIDLDAIIDTSLEANSRLGFFAALYREVTVAVKHGIEQGRFQDGARMQRLDVAFAQRYLDAYAAFRRGARPTQSWAVAFESAARPTPIILQHLLLGINAHINLDLGIAAAEVASGHELGGLLHDFNEINTVLAELTAGVMKKLDELSPWIGSLNRWFGEADDMLVSFSLGTAREGAWRFAESLVSADSSHWPALIEQRDTEIAALASDIAAPGFPLRLLVWVVRAAEAKDPRRIIKALCDRSRQARTQAETDHIDLPLASDRPAAQAAAKD